ncbi:unnamed protein product [Pleuronectes platessa]|uniref:Uncharacterized protein n=1 Tax=Pleuronectes platessa TaxID=8262 RepID=A0A9N7VHQ6_PLEPL|nr:unnamed protein product [Pleuronectes platessa]
MLIGLRGAEPQQINSSERIMAQADIKHRPTPQTHIFILLRTRGEALERRRERKRTGGGMIVMESNPAIYAGNLSRGSPTSLPIVIGTGTGSGSALKPQRSNTWISGGWGSWVMPRRSVVFRFSECDSAVRALESCLHQHAEPTASLLTWELCWTTEGYTAVSGTFTARLSRRTCTGGERRGRLQAGGACVGDDLPPNSHQL